MEKLLSVIIPIYNVEKYLSECLDSVCKQTIENMEIICVNDGSTDTSKTILDEYAKKDDRIIVVDKSNGGLSSARNAGIKKSKGKYIVFLDSDDKLKENAYDNIIKIAENDQCEVVMFGYETFPNEKKVTPGFKCNKVLSRKELIESNDKIFTKNDFCFSWRFLIRRSFIEKKDIYFNERILFAEDTPYNMSLLLNSNRTYIVEETPYLYRVNNMESIMRKKYNPFMQNSLIIQYEDKIKLIEEFKLINNEKVMENFDFYNLTSIRELLIKNINNSSVDKKKELKSLVNCKIITESFNRIGFFRLLSMLENYNFREKFYVGLLFFKMHKFLNIINKKNYG